MITNWVENILVPILIEFVDDVSAMREMMFL
jgi:hypothetical protein